MYLVTLHVIVRVGKKFVITPVVAERRGPNLFYVFLAHV